MNYLGYLGTSGDISSGSSFSYSGDNDIVIWDYSKSSRSRMKMMNAWYAVGQFNSLEPSASFGAEQSITNYPPEFSDEIPTDGSTTTNLPCVLYINITDPEGDMFNYSWGCSDGSSNLASGNTNGTKIFMLNHCTVCGHQYTWWVNASEYGNPANYTNESFNFVTRLCEGQYSEIHPENNSASVCPCHICENNSCVCINGTLEGGGTVNISFYSNYSGSWQMFQKISNVSGMYCAFFPVDYETQYWWYANVTEYNSDSNYNQTDVFTFTTDSYVDCIAECPDCNSSTNLTINELENNCTLNYTTAYSKWFGWTVDVSCDGNCSGGGTTLLRQMKETWPGIGLMVALAMMFFMCGYLVHEDKKKKKKGGEKE